MECNLCKKEINTEKERYTHVEDWNKEKRTTEVWCHSSCFRKAMNRDLTELELKAKQMLSQAGKIFNKISPQMEEFEIKWKKIKKEQYKLFYSL